MNKIGIIGGILAEIEGNPYGQLVNHDVNSGTISMSFSGTGRNIAENLARLGEDVIFATVSGNDFSGRSALRELEEIGVDVSAVDLKTGENTAAHIEVLNIVGDLEMALGNNDIYKSMDKEFLERKADILKSCKIVGIDGNVSEDALKYAVEVLKDTLLFLDPVSVSSAKKVKEIIGKFHTIKPDRGEAEAISGLTILSEEELHAAGKWFIEQGVKRVFITLGGGGVYYTDGKDSGFIRPEDSNVNNVKFILNPKGGGDAFSAAILSGFVQDYDVKTTAQLGMAAAKIALEHKEAVNPQITMQILNETFKEMYHIGTN